MKISIYTAFIALFIPLHCSAMEPTLKKRRTEAQHRAETFDIPKLQVFAHHLIAMEQDLACQIERSQELLQNQISSSELRERHPFIALPKTTLRKIHKERKLYESAVNLNKPKVEYGAWHNKVQGKNISYFANRQMTGKDPAAHAYRNTFKGMAYTLPEKIAHHTEERALKEGDLFLAQATNDHEEIIAHEKEIKHSQGCIDEYKMHARIVFDSFAFEKEPNELLIEKFKKILDIKK